MNLFPRQTQLGGRQMILLAPSLSGVPDAFRYADVQPVRHRELLAEMQQLRGSVYLQDGAIETSQLTPDGRHVLPVDERSWHVLTLDAQGQVCGCSRYLEHSNRVSFWQLELVKSALAQSASWGRKLQAAVEGEIAHARRRQVPYVEVGGWALSEQLRCTTEALRIALGTYSLAKILGGCIGISTVTVRNCSSSILRRIGGSALDIAGEILPRYFDPQYRCDMEILRFDSHAPNPRFREWIDRIKTQLLGVPVVCAGAGWSGFMEPVETAAVLDSRRQGAALPKTA
jgi:hypothetical protein